MTRRPDINIGKDAPRVKVAVKADDTKVLSVLLLVLGGVVLLISRMISGI